MSGSAIPKRQFKYTTLDNDELSSLSTDATVIGINMSENSEEAISGSSRQFDCTTFDNDESSNLIPDATDIGKNMLERSEEVMTGRQFKYTTLDNDESSNLSPDDLFTYNGLCLIINNIEFDHSKSIPSGEADEATMRKIFELRGFDVKAHRNLSKSEMLKILEEYQKRKHTGCFVIIILSHGENGVVLSRDDQELSIEDDIAKKFHKTECPSLDGKPRILIISAQTSQPHSLECENISKTMVDPTEIFGDLTETSNDLTETTIDPTETSNDLTETTIDPTEISDDLTEKRDRMTSSFSRAENEEDDIAIIIVSEHTSQHRSLGHTCTSSKTTDLTENANDSTEFETSIDFTENENRLTSSVSRAQSEEDDVSSDDVTNPGKPSNLDVNGSSHFTKLFYQVMNDEMHMNMEFNDIMTNLQNRISKDQHENRNQSTVQIVSKLKTKYHFKTMEELKDIHQLQEKHNKCVCEWIKERKTTIIMIREIATNLVTHRRNVNITRITGSIAAIGGTSIAILGFALTPVTFGASLALTIFGASIGTAGGLTAAGASITDTILTKLGVREAQKQVQCDQDKLKEIQSVEEEIAKLNERIRKKYPDLTYMDIALATEIISFFQGGARVANLAFRIGEVAGIGAAEFGALGLRVGGAAARGVAAVGVVLNVVIIPIDIIEIVRSGWNIWNNNESNATKRLNEIADELEEQKDDICRQLGLLNITED